MKIRFLKKQSLVNLPPNVELAVFLIREELKNVKFTNDLNKAGIDTYHGFLDFSPLIASLVGFENNLSDEFTEWYFERQSELVDGIDICNDQQLLEQAFIFYVDLVVKRRKWEEKE